MVDFDDFGDFGDFDDFAGFSVDLVALFESSVEPGELSDEVLVLAYPSLYQPPPLR